MKLALVLVIASAGCAQILGLDETKLDKHDAGVDAPNVCDTPAIACTASTGHSVCGQLTNAANGAPLRVADPQAVSCTGADGPCALTVFGQPLASYYQGTTTGRVAAQIDDCGHFAIADLDMAAKDFAVIATGSGTATSGRIVLDATTPTTDHVAVPVVQTATVTAWAMQLGLAESALAQGYLVRYLDGAGAPVAMEEVRVGGAAVGPPGTPPWAAYFSTDFETLDPALTATGSPGTALISPPAGTFKIGGFHVGKQCFHDGFQAVSNTYLSLVLGGTPPGC